MRKPRKVVKDEYVRHPFTRQRLLVIDTFPPKSELACPLCREQSVEMIRTIESEYRGGVRYQVLDCGACQQSAWVVLLG